MLTIKELNKKNDVELIQLYEELYDFDVADGVGQEGMVRPARFIGLETGHGGQVTGNIFPLHIKLILNKDEKNPFEWIKEPEMKNIVPKKKFFTLIEHLASDNNLTVTEFRDYVYWCYDNPRSIEEVKKDQRYSLDIWKESSKRI